MIPDRDDIPQEHTWNMEYIYEDLSYWNADLQECSQKKDWPKKEAYEDQLEDPKIAKQLFDQVFSLERWIEKLYAYAHHRYDENLKNTDYKEAYIKVKHLHTEFQQATSWIRPAILSLDEETFLQLLESESLKDYKRILQSMERIRKHTLSEKEESLLALAQQPLSSLHMAFSALNNADLAFAPAIDRSGQERELSQSAYGRYLHSSDRELRKSAYENFLAEYAAHENTFTELLQGKVASHAYLARTRNFQNSLEAALYNNKIDTEVYHNLISTVKENIQALHKYVTLRKKVLGLDELRRYDLYVPLVHYNGFNMSYDEARATVVDSVSALGKEYQTTLRKGLYEERWVDVYENKNKRSGAYSGGCYDSYPYILLNFPVNGGTESLKDSGNLREVFTLAHESGHSMHTQKSRENQPFVDANYPIFVAEVASTLNEQLLLHNLLGKAESREEKAYLISYAIDSICGTLFRQTLFAEFELQLHEWVENGTPITPQLVRNEYQKLHEEYYGPDLVMDPLLGVECLRIPHFYYNFYVYQYATGISAALALWKEITKDAAAKDRYLTFLSSGGSKFPLELLELAGIDMRKKEPIASAIDHFSSLVEQLEALLETTDPVEPVH
ncbi:MAG: oligoendopeptidase F [Chlamydiota bacterium]